MNVFLKGSWFDKHGMKKAYMHDIMFWPVSPMHDVSMSTKLLQKQRKMCMFCCYQCFPSLGENKTISQEWAFCMLKHDLFFFFFFTLQLYIRYSNLSWFNLQFWLKYASNNAEFCRIWQSCLKNCMIRFFFNILIAVLIFVLLSVEGEAIFIKAAYFDYFIL